MSSRSITEQVGDGVRIQIQVVWLQSRALKQNNPASWERPAKGSVKPARPNDHRLPSPVPPQSPLLTHPQQSQSGETVPRVYTFRSLLLWIPCCQSSSMTQGMEGRERSWRGCSHWCYRFPSPQTQVGQIWCLVAAVLWPFDSCFRWLTAWWSRF